MNQKGYAPITVLITILILIVVAGGAYYWEKQPGSTNSAQLTLRSVSQSTVSPITPTPSPSDPYSGWKTYSSSIEQASFRYPADWTISKSFEAPTVGAEEIDIISPSRKVEMSWESGEKGSDGECDMQIPLNNDGNVIPCPLITVLDKTPISGAPGLYVVTGIVTNDGKSYTPWMAVQDKNGIMTTQRKGDDLFQGRYNGKGREGNSYVLFSTAGISPDVSSFEPVQSESLAESYFNELELKQAKLILLSLVDPK